VSDNDVWRIWDRDTGYGETLYRRAVGELPEMESSKAVALILKDVVRENDRILDVGCGPGHYLRSFRREMARPFFYDGVDATENYVRLGRKAWAGTPGVAFHQADAFALPFEDGAFDVVTSSNLLLHLPSIRIPLTEMVRVAGRFVLVRMPMSDRSFRIQEVYSPETHPGSPALAPGQDEFDAAGEPRNFYYFNIYAESYVRKVVTGLPRVAGVDIVEDRDFDAAAIAGDAGKDDAPVNTTSLIGGWQANGPILLQWRTLRIRMDGF
jgi:ubiquinone/menaquinone biosynthesis C-methylase UbiE